MPVPLAVGALAIRLPVAAPAAPGPTASGSASGAGLVLVEMFKAHLVMIQRNLKSANPYARETEKGPRPGDAVKAPLSLSLRLPVAQPIVLVASHT